MQLDQCQSIIQNGTSQSSDYSSFVALRRSVIKILTHNSAAFTELFLVSFSLNANYGVGPQIMLVISWLNKPEISTHEYVLNNARKMFIVFYGYAKISKIRR